MAQLNFDDLAALLDYKDGKLYVKDTDIRICKPQINGYTRVRVLGHTYYAHKVIWCMFNGEVPDGYELDHIDGNKRNNRLENLRLATRTQNVWNRARTVRGSARGYVTLGGTVIGKAVGSEADKLYQAAAKAKYGDFYRSNQ